MTEKIAQCLETFGMHAACKSEKSLRTLIKNIKSKTEIVKNLVLTQKLTPYPIVTVFILDKPENLSK